MAWAERTSPLPDLPRALAAEFDDVELHLIAGYLTVRAREARATLRQDEQDALARLEQAVTAARHLKHG